MRNSILRIGQYTITDKGVQIINIEAIAKLENEMRIGRAENIRDIISTISSGIQSKYEHPVPSINGGKIVIPDRSYTKHISRRHGKIVNIDGNFQYEQVSTYSPTMAYIDAFSIAPIIDKRGQQFITLNERPVLYLLGVPNLEKDLKGYFFEIINS